MKTQLTLLCTTAASLGFFHTLIGPDHYLPFIVMSRSGKWSRSKTALITFLCGLGHVLSSVVLGFAGIALGTAVSRLELIEGYRGNLAAWGLIAFGLVYMIWGLRKAARGETHSHTHSHDGTTHSHTHCHQEEEHLHLHREEESPSMTPWILFTIFAFGPCEPLIPLLMYPASQSSMYGVALVAGVFSLTTISTMMAMVMLGSMGLERIPLKGLEKYSHALAGAAIFLSGMAIQLLGL